jgi:CRISPR-associated protein Cas1
VRLFEGTIQDFKDPVDIYKALDKDSWKRFIPEKYEFDDRTGRYKSRPYGAGDMVNCMLNYGYSLLEAECMRTINAVGMDVHVGFLHEMASGKNSLAYDLQEPFRFLVDMAVINLIETDRMEKKDFIRTDNYSLRLRPSGAKKVTEEFQTWMNKKVTYQDKAMMWNYVLLLKTRELAQFLNGKKRIIDFTTPSYVIERQDTDEIRKKIIAISYTEWKKMGFSKGTLHYMKKNAKGDKPFTLNAHVRERLEMWE